jgi:DNA-binding NtrC family response regulator
VERLLTHEWPGNVRELRNVVEQTALFAPGEAVQPEDVQLGQGRIERRTRTRTQDTPHPAPPPPDEAERPSQPQVIDVAASVDAERVAEPASQPPPALVAPAPPPARPADPPASPEPTPPAEEEEHPLVLRLPVGTRLADAERKLILLTLEAVRGNKQRAARVLGISRRGLYSKLQAYGEHVGSHEAPEAAEATEAAEDPTPPEDTAEGPPPEVSPHA